MLRIVPSVILAAVLVTAPAVRAQGWEPLEGAIEAGLFTGVFFPSSDHDHVDAPGSTRSPLQAGGFELGARLGYYPMPFWGAELEGAVVPTSTGGAPTSAVTLYAFRAHLIAQLPTGFTPFVLLGPGLVGISSSAAALGSDADFAFHWGFGGKAYLGDGLSLRLDLRHDITAGTDGLASHFEVVGGVSFVFGGMPFEEPPVQGRDGDADDVPDEDDACPDDPHDTPDGCPSRTKDSDGDGVLDKDDRCPADPQPTADGCPGEIMDSDGDGVGDEQDKCPDAPHKTRDGCPADTKGGEGGDRAPPKPTIEAAPVAVPKKAAAAPKRAPSIGGSRTVSSIRTEGKIVIDGHSRDPGWAGAAVHGDFWQREPSEGAPVRSKTNFRVAHDHQALYIAIDATDARPNEIRGLLTRRDKDSSSDWLWVYIDSYFDKRTAFVFAINPAGVLRDAMIYDDGTALDFNWDAVWDGKAVTTPTGWSAELRIPYSQLRFAAKPGAVWGLQVARRVRRTKEVSYWSPWPRASAGQVSRFGKLRGIGGADAGGGVVLVPYGVIGVGRDATETRAIANLGIDASYSLMTNVTLSATINPDFGQVEADPSKVNLTAGETFFAEKRSFFVEGSNLFRQRIASAAGDDELFYSRRIGAAPRGGLASGDAKVRTPTATTIFGSAKLSGKTQSGWSVGALNALTAKEVVDVPTGADTSRQRVLEPLTNHTVVSLHKDLREGRTKVGGVATAVHRDLTGTGLEWMHDKAYAASLDVSHRFADDQWYVRSKLIGSAVFGSAEAILRTQEASQRYFQRPDADHLTRDPGRRELFGAAVQGEVGRVGESLRGAAGFRTRSPGFEINDLGFQRGADLFVPWFWVQLRDDRPGPIFNTWSVDFGGWIETDYGGRLNDAGVYSNALAGFANFWSATLGLSHDVNAWSPGALRGGPALRDTPSWRASASVTTDPRYRVSGSAGGSVDFTHEGDTWGASAWTDLLFQVGGNLDISLGPFVAHSANDLQYVRTTFASNRTAHHILGRIEQTSFGMTLRVNYTVLPTLSFQLYAQPYFSAGRYPGYKDVVSPGADQYADRFVAVEPGGGPPERNFTRADFNFRSLTTNLIGRWEYMRGSTLFLVWSHARSDSDTVGAVDFAAAVEGLASSPGEHVIMAKLSHRFEI